MKKTKIVATISDKRCDVEFLRKLHKCGMDVVRLNTAHQSFKEALKVIDNVRRVSDNIPILVDTKGPEIRTSVTKTPYDVKCGDIIKVIGDPNNETTAECVYVSYPGFVNEVPLYSQIMIDDGQLELVVNEKKDGALICIVKNDGKIESRKSINVPNVSFKLPSLTDKDISFIEFAVEQDLDFIAHSFVRHKDDVLAVQKILDEKCSSIKIIAKIENQEGVNNIDEILDFAYGIMIARGDLAIEIPFEKIPGIQKMIVEKCIARRKPVIVATQMLHTMIENPRPTRAEVSDIANAIYSKTDAIMLSGETAYGQYPIEAVQVMTKVARETERQSAAMHDVPTVVLSNERSAFLSKVAVEASIKLNAKAIIADTSSGNSIRNMAGFRGLKPIYAHCLNKKVMRLLALSYGVVPHHTEKTRNSHEFVHKALECHIDENTLTYDDLVIVMAGNFGDSYGASFIEISPVEMLMNRY